MHKGRTILLIITFAVLIAGIVGVGAYYDYADHLSGWFLVSSVLLIVIALGLFVVTILHRDRDIALKERDNNSEAHGYLAQTFLDQTAVDRALTDVALTVKKCVANEDEFRATYSYKWEEGKPEDAEKLFLAGATNRREDTESVIKRFWRVMRAAKAVRHDLDYREHWTDYLPEEHPEKVPPEVFGDASVTECEGREENENHPIVTIDEGDER